MFINGYYVYMDLARTQFLSLVTKAITTFLGIAQSILVVRILSPAEYGLVGLVMSVGAVIGVSQHLGIVDGAIREIAIRKKKRDVGKVFWVSHAFRQAVTIPLSIILLLFASAIAGGVYNHPEIAVYIQIFAAALVLQGLQDVLGATLTGMKKFGALYIVQVVTAVINIAVFGLLTWMYGVWGFFIAIVITTSIMVVLLGGLVARHLKGNLALPSRRDIKKYGRNVMRIGAFMYLARIFFVVWQRLPILVLGGVLAADELGYLNVSLTFGSRLTIIAMALSEVNLSWIIDGSMTRARLLPMLKIPPPLLELRFCRKRNHIAKSTPTNIASKNMVVGEKALDELARMTSTLCARSTSHVCGVSAMTVSNRV